MKRNDFNEFRENLIKSEFTGTYMCLAWAFFKCTEKQIGTLKKDVITHAREFTALPNGGIKCGSYIFK